MTLSCHQIKKPTQVGTTQKTKFSNKCDNTYFINNLQKLKNTSKNTLYQLTLQKNSIR